MAEETGLIVQLGEWVMRKACHQTRDWQERFPREDGDLAALGQRQSFREAIPASRPGRAGEAHPRRVAPRRRSLHLEITESVIMENSTQAASLLRQLEALHVRVHLDDFGTGYSSLAYLHNFRMDALKVDGSFVRRMGPRARTARSSAPSSTWRATCACR